MTFNQKIIIYVIPTSVKLAYHQRIDQEIQRENIEIIKYKIRSILIIIIIIKKFQIPTDHNIHEDSQIILTHIKENNTIIIVIHLVSSVSHIISE